MKTSQPSPLSVSLLVGLWLLLVGSGVLLAGPLAAQSSPALEPGALIVVAGRFGAGDELQRNIHNVTNAAYRRFGMGGYSADRIRYLATDLALDADGDGQADVAGLANRENLQGAISSWAVERVGAERPLVLYLMGPGEQERFYLDGTRDEFLAPSDLDGWLAELEGRVAGLPVVVVLDTVYAGGFVLPPETVSRPGRLVVTATSAEELAWSTQDGALFSDPFLAALGPGVNLWQAFQAAQAAVAASGLPQTPWVDGDGDGTPNEPADQARAADVLLFSQAALTPTASATETALPSSTPRATESPTPSVTVGPSPSATASPSATVTSEVSPSPTGSPTATQAVTPTPTGTVSAAEAVVYLPLVRRPLPLPTEPPTPIPTETAPPPSPTPTVPGCLAAEREPNNFIAQAMVYGPLCAGGLQATLPATDPDDYFWIQVGAGGLAVDLTEIPVVSDYDLALYDGARQEIATSRHRGPEDEHLALPMLPPGDYYLRVYPDPSAQRSPLPYRLTWR